MRRLPLLLTLAALLVVVAACGGDDAGEGADTAPTAFVYRIDSGPIAPPYNNITTLRGTIDGDAVEATVEVRYQARNEQQLADPALPQDTTWSGRLSPDLATRAISLAVAPVAPFEETDRIGGSIPRLEVTRGERVEQGQPADPEAWRSLLADVEKQAKITRP